MAHTPNTSEPLALDFSHPLLTSIADLLGHPDLLGSAYARPRIAQRILELVAGHIRVSVPLVECVEAEEGAQQIFFETATVAELEKYRAEGLHPLLENAMADHLQGVAVKP